MIRHTRPSTRTCNTLLLTVAALAVLTAACSSSSSSNPPLPDASPPKLDTAPAMLPDASLPNLDTAPVQVPDASLPNLDTAPAMLLDATPPKLDTNPPDAPADLPLATGGAGGKDGGTGGTGGTAGIDGSADRPSSGPDAGDAAGDGGSADGGDGGFTCATPKAAWEYDVGLLPGIGWDNDGSLITATTYFPLVTPAVFGSKTVTSYGSADMLVAKIDPSSGNASWVITVGDELDQNVTSVAVSSASPGVIGTFTGTLDVFNGNQPNKVIVNSAPTAVDFIAGLNDADGSGLWAKKVNLGGGGLNAIAGQPAKDFFVVCGAAMNNAASLAVTGTTTPPGTPGGGNDVVVAAVKASDGSVIWSHLFGGAGNQACTAAALDDDGNAIFAGTYAGALDLGLGALSPAPTGAGDKILWVAKLNGATGATLAAKAFGTTGIVQAGSVTPDAQGNVIVAGALFAPVTFGSVTLTPLGQNDAFVAKLDASLLPSWARRWGGAAGIATNQGAAVDSKGDVTVVGDFRGTIDVGPGDTVLTSTGTQPTNLNPFIVTLDGATGKTLCAQAYGDAALKGGNATAVAVNRRATGANQDAVAVVGTFLPGIDFGKPTTPLVTPQAMSTGGSGFLLRM
jgi:hypothetical protein